MPSKRKRPRPTIHPKNKYSDETPDFHRLACLYPTFKAFVRYTGGGRPSIDWTDYNATRELTRILLLHDHGVNWWIPDGQLCPTVPNRSNYIHWIEDLLSSEIIKKPDSCLENVRGFDIGTGANCIYPLLGASLLGWRFVGSEEAGLNPKTSCGGTTDEMVCHGGEEAFIIRLIEDSVELKQSFRWYTSMVGRKSNLKVLISKLREVGVTIVKTTEFVQGKTCRWGLAWSFAPPSRKVISPHLAEKSVLSFMLEGIKRQFNSMDVLQSVEGFFQSSGVSCKMNASLFYIDVNASKGQCCKIINCEERHEMSAGSGLLVQESNLSFRILVFQQIPGSLLVKGVLQDKNSPLIGIFVMLFQKLEDVLRSTFRK